MLFGAGLAAAAHFVLLLLPTMAYMARRALVSFGLPLTALPMNFQTGEGVGLHLLLSFGFITCLAVFVNCIQVRPLLPLHPPSPMRRSSPLVWFVRLPGARRATLTLWPCAALCRALPPLAARQQRGRLVMARLAVAPTFGRRGGCVHPRVYSVYYVQARPRPALATPACASELLRRRLAQAFTLPGQRQLLPYQSRPRPCHHVADP